MVTRQTVYAAFKHEMIATVHRRLGMKREKMRSDSASCRRVGDAAKLIWPLGSAALVSLVDVRTSRAYCDP